MSTDAWGAAHAVLIAVVLAGAWLRRVEVLLVVGFAWAALIAAAVVTTPGAW